MAKLNKRYLDDLSTSDGRERYLGIEVEDALELAEQTEV
jgi:hypothetical protein